MIRIIAASAALALSLSQPAASAQTPCAPLLSTEPDGKVSAGSKQRLIEAVRSGAPVRVGWELDFERDGKIDLVHWAPAHFLTVFEGEVFAQIPPISKQEPILKTADVRLAKSPGAWQGLLGSTGFVEGRFSDESETKRLPARVIWCAP
jgi:hypothetical protein